MSKPEVRDRENDRKRRKWQRDVHGTELEDLPLKEVRKIKRGFLQGYRSGLEKTVALWIETANRPVLFETDKIKYTVPEREATYTPDFKLFKADGSHFYVETKGLLKAEDRKKHLLIRDSNPDLDIRFLFQRAKSPINKGSKTTYGAWATKHGFMWAEKDIPQSWLEE